MTRSTRIEDLLAAKVLATKTSTALPRWYLP